VVIITHSTEGSPHKARGSSVHHDVADSIFSVEVDKTQARHIQMVKYRQHRNSMGNFTSQMGEVVVTAPDSVTHLVDLDLGAMTLNGLHLPSGAAAAAAFTTMPTTHEDPDTDSDSELEDDEL
jgi:hypothetical protein